jgi:hypothetical protein
MPFLDTISLSIEKDIGHYFHPYHVTKQVRQTKKDKNTIRRATLKGRP